jgi:hypothetical protein
MAEPRLEARWYALLSAQRRTALLAVEWSERRAIERLWSRSTVDLGPSWFGGEPWLVEAERSAATDLEVSHA